MCYTKNVEFGFVMSEKDFYKMVKREIRNHELRVAIISSIIGFVILFGIFHAIYLNHQLYLEILDKIN